MSVDTAQLEQARARIQQWVREIAVLSRTNISLSEYFPQFLDRVAHSIDAQGGAIWLIASKDIQLFCEIRIDDIEFKSNPVQRSGILRALKDVVENKRPLVVSPLSPDLFPQSATSTPGSTTEDTTIVNQTRYPLFYVPLMVDQQAVGVLQTWQKPHRDPKTNQDFITFLTSVSSYAESYLKSRKMTELGRDVQQLQKLFLFSNALAGQFDEAQIAIAAVNHGREILHSDRCVLVCNRGDQWSVTGVSGAAQPQRKSQLVKVLANLGRSIPDNEPQVFYRADAAHTSPEADVYFSESNLNAVLAVPIRSREGKRLGTFLAESAASTPWPEPVRRLAGLMAEPVGHALTAARELQELPFLTVSRQLQKTRTALLGPQRHRTWIKVGAPVAALLIAAFMPWKLTVEGDCTLMPKIRAVVPSEVPGRITEVLVDEGDDVRAGQVLARIDDTRVKLDLAMSQQEKARWQTEAERQRAAGDEGQRRVAELQAGLAAEQVAKLQRELSLCELRSPFEGRVVTTHLRLKTGQVLQEGEPFCEVANLGAWECTINLREADVSQVDDRLRAGKDVPVAFRLYSHTTKSWNADAADLSRVSQLSTTAERMNVFQVTADVTSGGDLSREFKPGYTGRAKLDAGWRMAGYVFTRRFLNYLRVEWLF